MGHRPLWAISALYRPAHLVGGEAKIPPSILKTIRTVHRGMTRAKFDRLFAPYTAPLTSDFGPINGEDNTWASGRTNPQYFYYRRAYITGWMGNRKPDTTHWILKPAAGNGTLIMLDVSWAYSDRYQRQKYYRYLRPHHHTLIFAPVYDGVAGGSPDDVITRVSSPYLTFDAGIHG